MSFNWNDISNHPLGQLKEQCKSLNIPTGDKPTKRELVSKIQNYRNQMNLNKVKNSPLSSHSQSSSAYSSRQASPVPSRMTPISTTKPSYLSSSRKNASSKHSTNKTAKKITPVNKTVKKSNYVDSSSGNNSWIILLIVIIIIIISIIIFL